MLYRFFRQISLYLCRNEVDCSLGTCFNDWYGNSFKKNLLPFAKTGINRQVSVTLDLAIGWRSPQNFSLHLKSGTRQKIPGLREVVLRISTTSLKPGEI
jgi:hypothetical protein